jgi:hypothetical protein
MGDTAESGWVSIRVTRPMWAMMSATRFEAASA